MKLFFILLALGVSTCAAPAFDHTHAAFSKTLQRFVKNGAVDYRAWKASPNELGAYLDTLAAVPESEFKTWSAPQQIAFLTNFYNAQTIKLVIDRYPVRSIKEIGGWRGPWKQKVVHIWGGLKTLDDLEHKLLRKNYREARIHFALVCAARGCPPLRSEAFQAARLSAQLDDQGRRFLNQSAKNRVDLKKNILHLSPIFEWFAADFKTEKGTIEAFVQPYLPERYANAIKGGDFEIQFTPYDWSLNDVP